MGGREGRKGRIGERERGSVYISATYVCEYVWSSSWFWKVIWFFNRGFLLFT
jgi:hypothetical protein